ncbi:sialic acid-binding Ig-like lectin 11 isoform X2 [Rhinolophus ferrumequinum]|uniref:sialic acid-binding Ig-like lectin 11 isoform X2 n=1 Tax=Rhinolophus ferrumequinum TaxID=59479 RepID=UPI00140FB223|nr:sialic acid-binding Ig-like lectin 11 isoform X2 [Rhinolophus ferrumequinum]
MACILSLPLSSERRSQRRSSSVIFVVPEVPLLWVVTVPSRSFLLEFPSETDRQVQKRDSQKTGRAPGTLEMLRLLLPLLWTGSLQKDLEYELHVQESVTVQEGLCVFVPCSVSYPWADWQDRTPAHGYWFQKKHNSKKDILVATNNHTEKVLKKIKPRFYLLGDPGAKNCSLSITDAQKRDSGKYYFQLERGHVNHTYQSDLLTVDVTGAAVRPLGLDSVDNSSEILLTPRPQDHGTNLTCRVTFPRTGARTERTLTLNVSYAPQNLAISIFRGNCTEMKYTGNGSSLPVREGDSLRLVCVADSNPPATLSWAQGSQTLSPSQPSDPGVLELPRVESVHEGEFTCKAQHPQGSLSISLHLSVHYPPQLLGPSCSWEEEGLHCSCSSRAQPAPSVHWQLGERLLEGDFSNTSFKVTFSSGDPWANSSLSLSEGLSSSLRLSCEAGNVHGTQSATVLLMPGNPKPGGRFLLGAGWGAGVAGLLSLSVYFLFRVKTCRKKAPSTPGPSSWGRQHECPLSSPLPPPPPPVAAPTSGEEHELHYASLRFQATSAATSTTEYAEIKLCKGQNQLR